MPYEKIVDLKEQTAKQLIFTVRDLKSTLEMQAPEFDDLVSSIIWNYYYALVESTISPFDDYERWKSVFQNVKNITDMICKPLKGFALYTKPEVINLEQEKETASVRIKKEKDEGLIYINVSASSMKLLES